MRVFVDTSAFLAVVNRDDRHHAQAREIWEHLIHEEVVLICTNYIIVETLALIQHRFGMALVKAFQDDVVPILQIEWVDRALHQAGVAALLTANRRQLSLVDCISFATIRNLGIPAVFAFDPHFVEQGFGLVNSLG
jgi:predicted nucleic acid-binding protein